MARKCRNYDQLASEWVENLSTGNRKENTTYCGRMYYYGNRIHSYGSHHVIARAVDTPKGQVILFNCDTYSKTTSKHHSTVRYYLRNRKKFYVPDANTDHLSNIRYFREQADALRDKAKRAWKYRDRYISQAEAYEAQINEYLEYFPQAMLQRLTGRA